jgi:hypothetical protein
MDSGLRPLLSGENMNSLARNPDAGFSPANSVLPIRHSSESWNPVSFTLCKSLDPSFRWDDGIFSLPADRQILSPDSNGPSPE